MINKFIEIDSILEFWSQKYGLIVFKQYKDYEVRSISIIDDQGENYHIWIDVEDEKYIINAAYNGKRYKNKSDIESFSSELEIVYSKVDGWILDNGNTRILKKN